MRELIYTVLELEVWNRRATCVFCPGLNKAVCQIRTRSEKTDKLVANGCACESCKEKFENNELPKCEKCGRLKTESRFRYGKYICDCVKNEEDTDEKELPVLPIERRQTAFYERQINGLREELNTAEVEAQSHLDAMEAFEVWNKKHRQELLDKIKELETENKRLKELTPQELVKEIEELKIQLEKQNQQLAQIETPAKDKGIKGFFKLGGKK